MRRIHLLVAGVVLVVSFGVVDDAIAANVETVIGCTPSRPNEAVDPIVAFGDPQSEHEHAFFGARGLTATSTPQDLRGTPTSCKTPGQTSAYWIPTANRPAFHLGVYYSNRFSPQRVGIVPADTELVIGNGNVAGDGKQSVFWTCSGKAATNGISKADTPLPCTTDRDTLVIRFPNCWDGQAINPAPGKDNAHFAYSSGGPQMFKIGTGAVCPSGFPVRITQTNAHFRFRNANGEVISSFSSGSPATAHGDFMQSWVTAAFQEFVDTCLNDPSQGACTGVF